jgi:tetratricopeptide (TPR) repeat protein
MQREEYMRQLCLKIACFAVVLMTLAGAGCTAKTKASYHERRATKYYETSNYAAAEIEYKSVLRYDPQNGGAWSRLGLIYSQQGRPLEAAPILARAEQLTPDNLEVRLNMGAIYLGFGEFSKARDEASFVLQKNPRDAQAPILLAETAVTTNEITATRQQLQALKQKTNSAPLEIAWGILARRENDLTTAEASFNLATTLDAKSADAWSALGNLYVLQKDSKRAEVAYQKAATLAPARSGNTLRYAQFKILSGDTATGEQLLRDLVKEAPDYLPAWMSLVQLAAAQKDYTNALSLLKNNVLRQDSQYYEGLSLQARLQLLSGNTSGAIEKLERMARTYPKVPVVHLQLAQAYMANNQTNQAAASLNTALTLNPKYTDALLMRASIQIYTGDTAPAIVTMRQLTQQEPASVPAWLLLAEAYRAEGLFKDAIQIYQQLENTYTNSPQIPLMLGRNFFQQQKYTDARREFEKSLKILPDYLPALEQLVDLDLFQKNYSSALQRVQQMVVKNPDQAVLQLLLGKSFVAGGETNQAETALNKAITLQPDSQAAYLMLAQLHSATGQKQKALDDLRTALQRDPENMAALLLMGMIYDSDQDYEKARVNYEKVLEKTPDSFVALNNLSCIYADHLGQLDRAYPLARRAAELNPNDPAIGDTLGWILFRRGEYLSALALIRQSAAKLTSIPAVQFHLGMAAYMTGFEEEAKTAFQAALKLTGGFPDKDLCRQRLAILKINPAKASADTRNWIEKWTSNHPDDPVAQSRQAAIYQLAGMNRQAATAYEAALKASPRNVNAMANLARLCESDDLPKAYQFAKSAYQLKPNDPDIMRLTGHLAFETGDFDWALSLLQLAAQARPADPEILFDLGQAFYSQGRVAQGRTAMQAALASGTAFVKTNEASRFLNLTALAASPAKAAAMEPQIQAILKASPGDVPALMVQTVISLQNSNWPAAIQSCETILNHYPNFSPAQRQLALLYARDPRNDIKAYALAVKAMAAYPNDPELTGTVGMLLYRRGDDASAVDMLQKSVSTDAGNPTWYYYLGLAQHRLKHDVEAKAALQQALKLNLSGDLANEAKRLITSLQDS